MCGNQKRSISKPMARRIGRAISDFSMIQEKDRILVGVSGGKDSNLLLYSLCGLRARSPVRFEVLAATVDPLEGKSDLSSIQEFTRSLGVELLIVKYPLFDILGRSFTPSPCSLCANIRRGLLASTAQKNGCNVLALGHHRDDAVSEMLRFQGLIGVRHRQQQESTISQQTGQPLNKNISPLRRNMLEDLHQNRYILSISFVAFLPSNL